MRSIGELEHVVSELAERVRGSCDDLLRLQSMAEQVRAICPACWGVAGGKRCSLCHGRRLVCPTCRGARILRMDRDYPAYRGCPDCTDWDARAPDDRYDEHGGPKFSYVYQGELRAIARSLGVDVEGLAWR